MNPETKKLIYKATELFVQTTGINVAHREVAQGERAFPDGVIQIRHPAIECEFTVQAKKNLTRATVLLEKTQPAVAIADRILITAYVTPPIADLMKEADLFFMDTAGNAYINKPPLFVFIKGNKPPDKIKTANIKRLFKPAGLKVVFTLLNMPDMANRPYRQIADLTDVALGTVDWIFRDLKAMGFLIEMGKRRRKLTNLDVLGRRWVEAYPDQLRHKLVIERFKADNPDWWQEVKIADHDMCWGGEVAAAKLTGHLKPGKIVIYANDLPGKLIIQNKLRKAEDGEIEILKPFWKFDHALADRGIVPPLLIYADLMATGDDRNIETAGLIYERYLVQPDRKDG